MARPAIEEACEGLMILPKASAARIGDEVEILGWPSGNCSETHLTGLQAEFGDKLELVRRNHRSLFALKITISTHDDLRKWGDAFRDALSYYLGMTVTAYTI